MHCLRVKVAPPPENRRQLRPPLKMHRKIPPMRNLRKRHNKKARKALVAIDLKKSDALPPSLASSLPNPSLSSFVSPPNANPAMEKCSTTFLARSLLAPSVRHTIVMSLSLRCTAGFQLPPSPSCSRRSKKIYTSRHDPA